MSKLFTLCYSLSIILSLNMIEEFIKNYIPDEVDMRNVLITIGICIIMYAICIIGNNIIEKRRSKK